MTIKTILAPMLGAASDETVLGAALAVARPANAHIEAVHLHPDPKRTAALRMGEGMSATMVESVVAASQNAYEASRADARARFEAWRDRSGVTETDGDPAAGTVSASWTEALGDPARTVARLGRVADLITVVRPGRGQHDEAGHVLEAALMQTGRAVLMVPPGRPAVQADSIAVGWNGSREAARAVAVAMPLLEQAQTVSILAATSDVVPAADVEHFAAALKRRGGDVRTILFQADGGNIARQLQARAEENGAGVLVLGAYSHSRLRELVFGGVTNDVLHEAQMPILMTH